jgi:ribosome-associated protein
MKKNMKIDTDLLNFIAQIIFDKKGFNILALDVRGLCSFAEYIFIAEGNVDKHVKAISEAIVEGLKGLKIVPYKVEGRMKGDWILIDCQGILINLFTPDLREKYQLEKLWSKGKIVDLVIDVEPEKIVGQL